MQQINNRNNRVLRLMNWKKQQCIYAMIVLAHVCVGNYFCGIISAHMLLWAYSMKIFHTRVYLHLHCDVSSPHEPHKRQQLPHTHIHRHIYTHTYRGICEYSEQIKHTKPSRKSRTATINEQLQKGYVDSCRCMYVCMCVRVWEIVSFAQKNCTCKHMLYTNTNLAASAVHCHIGGSMLCK